jgi:hypothetical protein
MPHLGFARTLAIAFCFSAWSLSAHAEPVKVSERARQHFEAGVNLLQDPDGARYEEAHREFKAAYAESPSWKILGNLGITAMKLERDGEAIEAFEKYLAEGGNELERAERQQFTRDLATLRTSVAWVTLRSVPAGAALSDERRPVSGPPVVNRYAELGAERKLGLRSGHHRIVASLAGHEDSVWEFDAQSGKTYEHAFELSPIAKPAEAVAPPEPAEQPLSAPVAVEPTASEPSNTPLYVGLGVTGALAIGAAVTGIMASGKHGDYEDENDGSDPARAQDLKDSGETLNLVTDVLLGGAVVAGAVTAVLYFTGSGPAASESASLQLTPLVSRAGGAMALSGRF